MAPPGAQRSASACRGHQILLLLAGEEAVASGGAPRPERLRPALQAAWPRPPAASSSKHAALDQGAFGAVGSLQGREHAGEGPA